MSPDRVGLRTVEHGACIEAVGRSCTRRVSHPPLGSQPGYTAVLRGSRLRYECWVYGSLPIHQTRALVKSPIIRRLSPNIASMGFDKQATPRGPSSVFHTRQRPRLDFPAELATQPVPPVLAGLIRWRRRKVVALDETGCGAVLAPLPASDHGWARVMLDFPLSRRTIKDIFDIFESEMLFHGRVYSVRPWKSTTPRPCYREQFSPAPL